MTMNLSETIRRQFTTMRHLYAGVVFNLLRVSSAVDNLYYDGECTVVADRVHAFFADQGVEITFPSPDGGLPLMARIAAPYRSSAIVKIVEGLLLATRPCPPSTPVPTMDEPYCWICIRPMREGEPELWFFPGEPVHVERVYRCPECDWVTRIEVTDRDEAERLASEVIGR